MVAISALALLTAWGMLVVVTTVVIMPQPIVRVAIVQQDAPLVPLWTFRDDPGGTFLGAAAIANFDADPDMEVAAFGESGIIYVLNGDGTKSWEFQTEHGSIPPNHLSFQANPSPSFEDFDGNGSMEVVIGTNGRILYILHDTDHDGRGEVLWSYPIGYWIHTTAAAADLDHDGILEVIVGADDRRIHVVHDANHDGSGEALWTYDTGYIVHSSPAIADMDGDGDLDVVVGAGLGIYVLHDTDHDGRGEVLWSYDTGHFVESSPAVGDVNGDGVLDVVSGSKSGSVYAVTETNHDGRGELLWSVRMGSVNSSPAIADMDGDGRVEVVAASTGGELRVLAGKTGADVWSNKFNRVSIIASPALADIDADLKLEVITSAADGKYAAVKDTDHDGQGEVVWDSTAGGITDSSPIVADINGDRKLDVVFGSGIGNLYALTITHSATAGTPSPWPKFHRDQANAGRYDYTFRRGDPDGSGTLDITDSIFTLNYLFKGGPQPGCLDAADADDSGSVDLSDPIFTLNYLFKGSGLEPPRPGPTTPGRDPTWDSLTCTTYPAH